MVLSPEDIARISSVVGAFSVIGSIAILCSYFLYPCARSPSRRLLCFLAGCDLAQGLFFMVAFAAENGGLCYIQTIWGILAAVSSFIWTACIAYYVYQSVYHPYQQQSQHTEPLFHILGWGCPTIFCILLCIIRPDIIGERDLEAAWCFISKRYPVWRLFAIYVPLVVCWILSGVWYFLSQRRLRRLAGLLSRTHGGISDRKIRDLQEVQQKLIAIPLLFVFLRMWGAAYRLVEFIKGPDATDTSAMDGFNWLRVMTALGDPAQGFANFVVFVLLTREVRVLFWQSGQRIWWRCTDQHYKIGNQESDSFLDLDLSDSAGPAYDDIDAYNNNNANTSAATDGTHRGYYQRAPASMLSPIESVSEEGSDVVYEPNQLASLH
jgi:Slime mold cyclic AMP receptor